VFQINYSAIHCLNLDCQHPYPQPWGNNFCNSCGSPLKLQGRYIPLQRLGAGGFAQVYTVWDQKTQTEKVLKVLVDESPKARELFAQEAAVLGNLQHPGVPKVDSDGYFHIETLHTTSLQQGNPKPRELPCLVMEKINGHTLDEILYKYPQGCPQELVISWLAQAVEILRELHSRNIIHRDIKPTNLMLRTASPSTSMVPGSSPTDQLVMIDFGGAKQFSSNLFHFQSSSTKLYSSGYSPPEQVAGGNVGFTADFYALGRTMIEMLTGKLLSDLEDPHTGALRWRHLVKVNPELAVLLDEMVQENVRLRPANATIIQKRLKKVSQRTSGLGFFSQLGKEIGYWLGQVLSFFSHLEKAITQLLVIFIQGIGKIVIFIFTAVVNLVLASVVTIWTMVITGISASFGAMTGLILASWTNFDEQVATFMSYQLSEQIPNYPTVSGAQILLFAGAGLGTAWGLTVVGGFGQRRRFLEASLMGIIGYGIGWLVFQFTTPKDSSERLVGLIVAAVSLLTLGLGHSSHKIVHATIAALGTAILFTGLIILGFPIEIFDFFSPSNEHHLWLGVVFFGAMGVFISFWLAVSYYLIVPGLRFLGWR
jgi:serine/threonine protein kinase